MISGLSPLSCKFSRCDVVGGTEGPERKALFCFSCVCSQRIHYQKVACMTLLLSWYIMDLGE